MTKLTLQDAGNNIWTYEKLSETECKLVSKGQRLGDPDYVLFQPIQNVRDWIRIGTWKISHSDGYTFTYPDMLYNESLAVLTNEKFVLDEIKAFTDKSVNSTVRILKGRGYELSSKSGPRAAYVNTDEELLELMNAVLVLERALEYKAFAGVVYGE